MLKMIGLTLTLPILTTLVSAETVKVGFEPMPPLIVNADAGYTIKILKAIEVISDLHFDIVMMPYIRGKRELKEGAIDLVGHTPYRLEVNDFYEYAQEIDFKIDVKTDLYTLGDRGLPDLSKLKIGVPRGNEEFAASLLGVPVANLIAGDMGNLLQMMEVGRIDAFWFERASTIETIKKLKIRNVFYREYPAQQIQASLAVRRVRVGDDLREKLEKLLKRIDQKRILGDFDSYAKLPAKGVVYLRDESMILRSTAGMVP